MSTWTQNAELWGELCSWEEDSVQTGKARGGELDMVGLCGYQTLNGRQCQQQHVHKLHMGRVLTFHTILEYLILLGQNHRVILQQVTPQQGHQ